MGSMRRAVGLQCGNPGRRCPSLCLPAEVQGRVSLAYSGPRVHPGANQCSPKRILWWARGHGSPVHPDGRAWLSRRSPPSPPCVVDHPHTCTLTHPCTHGNTLHTQVHTCSTGTHTFTPLRAHTHTHFSMEEIVAILEASIRRMGIALRVTSPSHTPGQEEPVCELSVTVTK